MTGILALTLLLFAAVFYLVFGFTVVYRACHKSCRTCLYHQNCLQQKLGFTPMLRPKVRCF